VAWLKCRTPPNLSADLAEPNGVRAGRQIKSCSSRVNLRQSVGLPCSCAGRPSRRSLCYNRLPSRHQRSNRCEPALATPFGIAAASRSSGRIDPGCSHWRRSNSSRDVRQGSASNQSRTCIVTVANESGRRRPRLAFSFGRLVGHASPLKRMQALKEGRGSKPWAAQLQHRLRSPALTGRGFCLCLAAGGRLVDR
jgi:hypothetical protein